MAKTTCFSCDARLPGGVPFCPSCGRPTPDATDEQRLEWDVIQWRAHVDRTVASIADGDHTATRTQVRTAPWTRETPIAAVPVRPLLDKRVEAPASAGLAEKRSRRLRKPQVSIRKPGRRPKATGPADAAHIDLDDPYAYASCAICHRTDWVLRTGRNSDHTWRYWCVRCSRPFKTSLRLQHGWKPFAGAGCMVAAIAVLTNLVLR